MTRLYDNNDRLYRVEVQNKDHTGAVDSGNPWLTTLYGLDADNTLTSIEIEVDSSTTATAVYEYTPGGRLEQITNPVGDVTKIESDERGLPFRIIEAPGTSVEGTSTYNYTLNGEISEIIDPRGNSTLSTETGRYHRRTGATAPPERRGRSHPRFPRRARDPRRVRQSCRKAIS